MGALLNFFTRYVLGGVASTLAVTSITSWFSEADKLNSIELIENVERQSLLCVVYSKYGLAGIKSMYNRGFASREELAAFYILERSTYNPPLSQDAVAELETTFNSGFSRPSWYEQLMGSAPTVGALATDISILAKALAYLLPFLSDRETTK